jgi:hypothetical protein
MKNMTCVNKLYGIPQNILPILLPSQSMSSYTHIFRSYSTLLEIFHFLLSMILFIMKEFKYEFIMGIMFMYIGLFTVITSHVTYGTKQ